MVQNLQIPQLTVAVSKTVVRYTPGGAPEGFEVTVINQSVEFASFRLDLVAAGVSSKDEQRWYRLHPSVSSKIPPGDRTQFQVEIIDLPPIQGGFVNSITVTVRVDALELGLQERRDVRLLVEGSPVSALGLKVRDPEIEVRPGDRFEIGVDVTNPNVKPADVLLELEGIDTAWCSEGVHQSLTVPAEGKGVVQFFGQVPDSIHAPQGSYFITVGGRRSPTPVTPTQVTLTVAPAGYVEVSHEPGTRQLPERSGRWRNPTQASTDFLIAAHNQSNCPLTVTTTLDDPDTPSTPSSRRPGALPQGWFHRWRKDQQPTPDAPTPATQKLETVTVEAANGRRILTLTPAQASLQPGDTADLRVHVTQRLPWFGWKRVKLLRAIPTLHTPSLTHPPTHPPTSSPITLRSRPRQPNQPDPTEAIPSAQDEDTESNGIQTLELHILPVIPFWLQGLGLLALLLLAIAPILLPKGHTKAVNTVQFSGRANEVISAADDATIRRWVVRGNRLRPAGVLERGDKAVRVVRYRPVNNDQMAAGFENGTILLHDFLSRHTESFVHRQDDRVFDLAFTPDSRRLFSAHGSGLILEWPAHPAMMANGPIQGIEVDFAIQSIGVVGAQDQFLAIAGRYNQITLYDRNAETFYDLPYLAGGGQNDYITSLATAGDRPTLFATSDNQGHIALWDVAACENAPQTCQPIDTWLGHGGNAVHSVALSTDGCYLASVGADGQSILWPLDQQGGRLAQHLEGEPIQDFRQPLNTIALIQQRDRLLIASGGDDTRVRLNTLRLRRSPFPGAPCQGL